MPERLWSLLHRFKTDWRLLAPLLFMNLAGMVFGYYYYWQVGQFDPSSPYYEPVWTWPLVADSPNAVLLFFVAALAYKLSQWRNKWLDAFAFTLNIYVGCWTTFLFLAYPDRMGTFDYASIATGNANPILFLAHMGMPLQAFVLAQDMRSDKWSMPAIGAVVAALAVYVFVDYWGLHIHPAPFLHDPGTTDDWFQWPLDRLLHLGSPLLMVGAAIAWLATLRVRPRPNGDSVDLREPLPEDSPQSPFGP
ncbi:MAG: DUF1405 domain-containing protein [Thermoplasmatota archaeon]